MKWIILGVSLLSTAFAVDPLCTDNNQGLVVHHPHESDCTKFYKCDWGVRVLQSCPPGLHFNPTLSVCDWPSEAGCSGGGGGGGDGGVTPPVSGTGPPGVADPRCNDNNEGLVVHLPHENDCTKFYKCDWGVAVLFACPANLHFNPTLSVCDWPSEAGCSGDGGNGGDGGDGGNTGSTLPPVSGGTCPPTNDGLVVHLPHENDCTKFYKCDWGVKVLQDCPANLHFNRVLSVCDYQEDANC